MSNSDFVHLHVHSHYSLLSAVGSPEKIAEKAKKEGMSAIALTDKGNMCGAIDFYKACKARNIKPIMGYEGFIASRSRLDKEVEDSISYSIVLLAKNNQGYRDLLFLASEANINGFFYNPRLDFDILNEYSKNLIAFSGGGQSEIVQSVINGDKEEKTLKIVEKYKKTFGDDFYIELQRHQNTNKEVFDVDGKLIDIAKKSNVKLLATNNAYYQYLDDNQVQDVMLCIRDNASRSDISRYSMIGDDYSISPKEKILEIFKDVHEACENSVKIANECNVEFKFGEYLLPNFDVPKGYDIKSFLQKKCEEGFVIRYRFHPKDAEDDNQIMAKKRLYYELDIINQMGFPSYFLIVWDFVKWAKDNNITVGPGRGSAAGSIVSYCLGITNIDPLKYDLLFERFLNPERVSMPDIDIDFADDQRNLVLQYVRGKYGKDRVAQICTFGTMAARASIKDVGRTMGLSFTDMNSFAKLIPDKPGISLSESLEMSPDLRKALEKRGDFKQIFELAQKLEGSVRHISVHACATVISPDPITNHTAIQRAPKDEETLITQFSQKPIDLLGLLKMDFLGLKNLTILANTLKLIEKIHNKKIDIDNIPIDDKDSFILLSKGRSTGIFQLESAGMKRYLKELKPTNLEDIIAMVSLYRPGPMEWIPDYIQGKHGKKKVKYLHNSLEPILEKTFGIAIYQEQILQIAQVFSGFELGQADILRRAIGKKIPEELMKQRVSFIDGAKVQGHTEKMAIEIFDKVIEPFAGYGFNKSHAAGYAMIAYQTAYLKANYPTEFMTALLSSDKENTDRVIVDIKECVEMGIKVLPPSVNESNVGFTVAEEGVIRFGLAAIKGLGESAINQIIDSRGTQKFTSLADFAIRCPSRSLNKKSLEALAKSGALSEFASPNDIINSTKLISDFSKEHDKKDDEFQDSLFGGDDFNTEDSLVLNKSDEVSNFEISFWEKETMGLFISSHPLKDFHNAFEEKAVLIKNLKDFRGKKVKVGGIVNFIRKIITKSGSQMAIIEIEDPTDKIEAVAFAKSYDKISDKLIEEKGILFWIDGKVDFRNGNYQIIIDDITHQPISEIEKDDNNIEEECFVIKLRNDLNKEDLLKVKEIISKNSGDTKVKIIINRKEKIIKEKVKVSDEFIRYISHFTS